MKVETLLLVLLVLEVKSLDRNDPCTTPNNENARCIAIRDCKVIVDAIQTQDKPAIEFAQKSQCGYDSEPLVCCGSSGYSKQPSYFDLFTKPPTLENKGTDKDATEAVIFSDFNTKALLEFNRERSQTASPLDGFQFLPDGSICGFQTVDGKAQGKATEITEFPWMAALVYTASDGTPAGVRCSGTLINQRYILTAAQCLNIPGYNLAKVRLGEWNLSTEKDCVLLNKEQYCSEPIDLAIVETISHPYYSTKSGNNDIALLRVARKLNFNEFIRPICLPPNDFLPPAPGHTMYITGYNITEDGIQPDVKSKTAIVTSSNKDCNKTHPDFLKFHPNMACAGGEPKRNSCNGDSGGALLRTYEGPDQLSEEQWFLEGVIYRGMGCQEETPALYLRVSRYIYWIVNNLKYS